MIKNFLNTAILTSQNPESFLTFFYDASNPATIYITPSLDVSIENNILLINGLDMYDASSYASSTLILSFDTSIASFYVFTSSVNDFDLNLTLTVYDDPERTIVNTTLDISILNRPFIINSDDINIYNPYDPLLDNESSYLLLRTNPKFSGNIKLFVDSSNNIYLDTFKVSDILSNKKYRKQKISGNSILSSDVRNTFNSLPVGEIYRLDSEDTLNIAVPKTNLYDQYNVTYSYGSRLLEDELYDDDYSILAPLWINSRLPDHFAIFRLDGVYNSETYSPSLSLDDLAYKYISESDLIKSWSLKTDQPLGIYLNSHLEELLSIRSPLFLSLGEDPNTWYGIAMDKGIITGRSEIPYFFENTINNFSDMNAFISEGFERNNLLCPNLINLEYTFNDDDVSIYSMHRYFGLYLTENQLYKIGYYTKYFDASIVEILSLDDNDSSLFIHSNIFDSSGNIISNYNNRIFVLNDGIQLNRISNVNQINGTKTYIENYLNKPGNNIFASPITQRTLKPFVTIKLNNKLNQGEHLRVINETQNIIWEVLSTDTSLLSKGECFPYNSVYDSLGYPTIYRTSFSVDGSILDQLKAIEKAFDSFSLYEPTAQFRVGIRQNDSLSLILNDDANTNEIWKFQRITSQSLININNPSSGFDTSEVINYITFMDVFNPSSSDYSFLSFDASYGPINFEFFGSRNTIFIDFYDSSILNLYNFDSSVSVEIPNYTYYQSLLDNKYKLIQPFTIITQLTSYDFNYISDPLTLKEKYLISTEDQINTINGNWYAYNVYPLYISLMGINHVKDMDFTVYDSSNLNFKSEYWYKRDNDSSISQFILNASEYVYIENRNSYSVISGQGNIEINGVQKSFINPTDVSPYMFNTFDGSAYIVASVDNTIISYNTLNYSLNYTSYDPSINEESIYDYYDDSSSKKSLKYGLTVPYVVKWSAIGNDCRNNELRLILKNIFDGSTSNYIPYILTDGSIYFKDEISYPSYKYLNTEGRNWKDYIFYDINDIIEYIEDSSVKRNTLKQLIFNKPYTDIFSKLLYSNNDVNGTFVRSSIIFFNEYKNTLDTLINGLNLSINVEDFAKNLFNIKNYDRYKFSFISSPSRNYNSNNPLELIINENTGTILLIWYQGNDILSYAYRNSTFLPGKSLLINDGLINNPGETNKNFQGFYTYNDASLYSFVKTPFVVNNTTLTSNIVNQYTLDVSFNEFSCSPYSQLNYNILTGAGSIFNAYSQNYVNSYQQFQGTNYSYNTFDSSVSYYYQNNLNTYGPNVINNGFKYSSNNNFYIDNTCNLSTFNTFLNRNQIMYYVIRDNLIYTNEDFVVPPFTIKINNPRLYNGLYTYNGYFKPKFNNILEFNYNEDIELINILQKDFILNNTNLKSYNYITQYFYNKVVETVGSLDISLGNAINYWDEFNVFKSIWDKNFYVRWDSSQNISYVNGYLSPKETPNFFGSKLIKLPYTLILDTTDIILASGSYDSNDQKITLTYNLTRMIKNKFINETIFINNWQGITGYDIDAYVEDTIIPYYNISVGKIKLNIYTKEGNENVISYTYENDMIEFKQQNMNTQLNYLNGDYIYTIEIKNIYKNNLNYYIKFTLFEI